jgi:hypothetical protein
MKPEDTGQRLLTTEMSRSGVRQMKAMQQHRPTRRWNRREQDCVTIPHSANSCWSVETYLMAYRLIDVSSWRVFSYLLTRYEHYSTIICNHIIIIIISDLGFVSLHINKQPKKWIKWTMTITVSILRSQSKAKPGTVQSEDRHIHTHEHHIVSKRNTTSPLTGCGGLWSCEKSRIQHCLDNRLIEGG